MRRLQLLSQSSLCCREKQVHSGYQELVYLRIILTKGTRKIFLQPVNINIFRIQAQPIICHMARRTGLPFLRCDLTAIKTAVSVIPLANLAKVFPVEARQ